MAVALILMLLTPAWAGVPEADAAMISGDPELAAAAYVEVLEQQVSADLYYNLGNALYRAERIGPAMLAWRRAQLLAPRDNDIQFNLDHARQRLTAAVPPSPRGGLFFWRGMLSLGEQGWAAASLLGFAGLLAAAGIRRRDLPIGMPLAVATILGLLLVGSTATELRERATTPGAVILGESVPVMSSGSGGVLLFELVEGAEVQRVHQVDAVVQIALPDGRRGWVPSDQVGIVDPRLPAID